LLANPAGAQHQLLGVTDPRHAEAVAEALRRLGTTHCLVIRGDDGMDEITCTRTTTVHEVVEDTVKTWTVDPRDLGVLLAPRHAVLGGPPDENALITRFLLEGKSSPYRNVAEMNAGAALLAADRVTSLQEGVALARETIASGAALRKLQEVVDVSQQLRP
jgi:anthranilate phosphoribosyltransferase